MNFAWMLPVVTTGSLILAGCFQTEPKEQEKKNELSYGAFFGLFWTQLPGTGKDIGVSAASKIWKIDAGSGDQAIRYYDLSVPNPTWTQSASGGAGVRVEVEDDGNVWVVNSFGGAWKANSVGSNWALYNTLSSGGTTTIWDIGAGGGAIWAVGGSSHATYGYQIFKLVNDQWTLYPGWAVKVTVDKNGSPWVINLPGDVFQYTGGSWIQRGQGTIKPSSIGAGSDGLVWITERGTNKIYIWRGTYWDPSDTGRGIEVDHGSGYPIVVNSANQIFKSKGTP